MTKEVFTNQLSKLAHAFRVDIPGEKTLTLYWGYLQGIGDDLFLEICNTIIKTERFFPAISVFIKIQDEIKKQSDPDRWPEWV